MTNEIKQAKELQKLKSNYLKKLSGEKRCDVAIQDIIAALKKGAYTACSLPHYRYQSRLGVALNFERLGWLERTGRDKTGINFKATEEFKNIMEITLANKQN